MDWNLVADIGGTNARFAIAHDGELKNQCVYGTRGKNSIEDITEDYVGRVGSLPLKAVVAAAGVVKNGEVTFSNANKCLAESDLIPFTRNRMARIVNDFEAAAWSIANFRNDDVQHLQGKQTAQYGNRVILGPGTGLGVAALTWSDKKPIVIPGEAGHCGVSPLSKEDFAIFDYIIEHNQECRFGSYYRIEAEAILSGLAIPTLYQGFLDLNGRPTRLETTASIFTMAQNRVDPEAVQTVQFFKRYLAQLAGDLAITFSADGGVFIAGGVAMANPWLFDEEFLAMFQAGGRLSSLRANTPIYLLKSNEMGLVGAMRAAESLF